MLKKFTFLMFLPLVTVQDSLATYELLYFLHSSLDFDQSATSIILYRRTVVLIGMLPFVVVDSSSLRANIVPSTYCIVDDSGSHVILHILLHHFKFWQMFSKVAVLVFLHL